MDQRELRDFSFHGGVFRFRMLQLSDKIRFLMKQKTGHVLTDFNGFCLFLFKINLG